MADRIAQRGHDGNAGVNIGKPGPPLLGRRAADARGDLIDDGARIAAIIPLLGRKSDGVAKAPPEVIFERRSGNESIVARSGRSDSVANRR